MNTQTGIVGVGNMGGGMAKRLLSLGWPVVVHDLDANKLSELNALGAQISANAAAVAQAADTVIVCVIDAAQIQQVFDGPQGLLAGLKAGQTVIMCPTIAPSDTEHFAQQLQAIGVHMVDAPMSGGPIRAGNGTMSLMLAASGITYAAKKAKGLKNGLSF
jgi:3-hydroxyisobutyrate dehydrogenase